jgi:hypothetical protein
MNLVSLVTGNYNLETTTIVASILAATFVFFGFFPGPFLFVQYVVTFGLFFASYFNHMESTSFLKFLMCFLILLAANTWLIWVRIL